MADISKELTSVSNDVYGEQVRTSIKNALNKINTLSGGGVVASISSELNTISSAVYGRDMRSAIHDALYKLNQAVEEGGGGSSSGDSVYSIWVVNRRNMGHTLRLNNTGKNNVVYIVNAIKDSTITPKFSYTQGTEPITGTFSGTTFTFIKNSVNNTIPNLVLSYGDSAQIVFNSETTSIERQLAVTYTIVDDGGGEETFTGVAMRLDEMVHASTSVEIGGTTYTKMIASKFTVKGDDSIPVFTRSFGASAGVRIINSSGDSSFGTVDLDLTSQQTATSPKALKKDAVYTIDVLYPDSQSTTRVDITWNEGGGDEPIPFDYFDISMDAGEYKVYNPEGALSGTVRFTIVGNTNYGIDIYTSESTSTSDAVKNATIIGNEYLDLPYSSYANKFLMFRSEVDNEVRISKV